MLNLNDPNYLAKRCGWLLSSQAPKNIARGERIYATLSPKYQNVAIRHQEHCNEIANKGMSNV